MNTFSKTVLIVLFAAAIAIAAMNGPVQQGRILPALGPLLQFAIPAKDLRKPTLCEPIDVSDTTRTFEYTFTNKYIGSYSFGIMGANLSQGIDQAVFPRFAFTVELSSGGQTLVDQTIDKAAYSFWGPYGDGFALFTYDVPNNVPVGTPIHCRVRVTAADENFQSKHGPAKVYTKRD